MNIQEDELKYKSNPTVSILGEKIDTMSLIMFSFGIGLSIFIWLYFGLYNQNRYNRYFLYAVCIFLFTQIFTSGTYIASYSIEDNEIKEVIQLNAVLFSSLVLLLALGNSNFESTHKKMLIIAIILSTFSLMYYNIKKDSGLKRAIRKLKIMFTTISIFVFINMLFILGVDKFGLLQTN